MSDQHLHCSDVPRCLLAGAALFLTNVAARPLGDDWPRHSPHDPAASLAAGRLPDGTEEIVVVTDDRSLLRSRDDLLSFQLITGDALIGTQPLAVSFNPTIPCSSPPQRSGCFVIGTDRGVCIYEPGPSPEGGRVYALNDGLLSGGDHRRIGVVASPDAETPGLQPSFLLSEEGVIYRLRPDLTGWDAVLETGIKSRFGHLALEPNFDVSQMGQPITVFASLEQVLLRSDHAGAHGSWEYVFDLGVASGPDWRITALALDHDFGSTNLARVYLGGTRLPSSGVPEHGRILVSDNRGQSFTSKHSIPTGVSSLAAAPPSQGSRATIFAAGRLFPGVGGYTETGILCSRDRGESWTDQESWQCFTLEHDPGHTSGSPELVHRQQLLVMPHYAATERLLYGRHEGLYLSNDGGRLFHAVRLRNPAEARAVALGQDAQGGLHVFAATYGGGLAIKDLQTSDELLVQRGMIASFQQTVEVSPNFAQDGAVLTGGTPGIIAWFDPSVDPPANIYGALGAFWLPLTHRSSGNLFAGYVRELALSPRFDARAGIGDKILYFASFENEVFVSLDLGRTYAEVNTTASGQPLPAFSDLAFAPTFTSGSTHNDVYASSEDGSLWRLTDSIWHKIADFEAPIQAIAPDPRYDGLVNRSILAAASNGYGVLEVKDRLQGGPVIWQWSDGLPEDRLTALVATDDGTDVWLYAATHASGIFRARFTGECRWRQLAPDGYPLAWTKSLAIAPSWPQDRQVFTGTGAGVWSMRDELNAVPWGKEFHGMVLDSMDTSLTTFAGHNFATPDPTLPWPWPAVPWFRLAGHQVFGEDVRVADSDGARAVTSGWARKVILHTYAGANAVPALGTVVLEVHRLSSGGQLLGRVAVDLATQTAVAQPWTVELSLPFPSAQAVAVTVLAQLDPGEVLPLDAVELKE